MRPSRNVDFQNPNSYDNRDHQSSSRYGDELDADIRLGTAQGSRSGAPMIEFNDRKVDTAVPSPRPTLKYKQLSTLYPAAKTGSFFNTNQPLQEQGIETNKEDKEAVEGLERWDNEFRIQMRKKNCVIWSLVSKNAEVDKNQNYKFNIDVMNNIKFPEINQEILNLIGNDDCK